MVGRPARHKGPVAEAIGSRKTVAGSVPPQRTARKVTGTVVIAMLRGDAGVRFQQPRIGHIPVNCRDQLIVLITIT